MALLNDAELALIHVNQNLQKMTAELERMHVASAAATHSLGTVGDLGGKLQHAHFAVEAAFGPHDWGGGGHFNQRGQWDGKDGAPGRDGRGARAGPAGTGATPT